VTPHPSESHPISLGLSRRYMLWSGHRRFQYLGALNPKPGAPLDSGIQLIPAEMRLRISIPDYDFRITNFDSVNLCTSKEHFHADFRFPHFHTDFLIGT
jgi:hypothetical protein